MPVVDLGPGRLHGNREPSSARREEGDREGNGTGKKKSKNSRRNNNNNDNGIHQEPGVERTPYAPLPRRVSVGNIENRIKQGKTAVWGGRNGPDGSIRGGSGDQDWWDTGTPYAFQPRLAADKTTVLSFAGTGGRRDRADQKRGLRGNGGVNDGDSFADSRTDSVASGFSVQHHQQQLQGGHGTSRELMRIVKVPESNEHHGQRVFFLA